MQLEEAAKTKEAWDEHTPAVDFNIGDLVQWYDTARDEGHKSINKLAPCWSTAHIISGKSLNSYKLSTLNGTELPSTYTSYHLQRFFPLCGSVLALSMLQPQDPHQVKNHNQTMKMKWRTECRTTSGPHLRNSILTAAPARALLPGTWTHHGSVVEEEVARSLCGH